MNVYIFFLRGGTSIGALVRKANMHSSSIAPAPVTSEHKPPAPKTALVEDPQGARIVDVVLADGQTLAQALTPSTGKRQATTLETAFGDELDLASVRAGEPLTLVYDEDERLVAVELRTSPVLAYRVDLGRRTTTSRIEGKAETRTVELSLPAGPSLWESLRRAGESATLGERLADLFGGDDSLALAPSAERIRAVVEKRYVGGRFQRYGRILGADWVSRAGLRRAFAFAGATYNEHGEAAQRTYLVSPLRAGQAQRSHHAAKGGTDARYTIEWSCAKDSIVRAVAAGSVTAITRGPQGASVTLEVGDGARVVYAHITKPSRLLSLGAEVVQGRTLGRTDGNVTLEYDGEAAKLARAFEESRVPAPRLASIPAADRPRFGEAIAPVLERLREIAVRASDPLATRSLGAIP